MQLIHRGRRFLTLTDEGELLARHGGEIISSLAELDSELAERRGEIVGQMRILAPLGFGRRYIAPLVADFQARNPRLQMELMLTDRPDRASSSAWDLAIHVGGLSDTTPSLIRNWRNGAAKSWDRCVFSRRLDLAGATSRPW